MLFKISNFVNTTIALGVMGLTSFHYAHAQTPEDNVRATLEDYIQGSSYNDVARLDKSFAKDAVLYLSKRDGSSWHISPQDYISLFNVANKGKFNNRYGRVLNIDITDNVASAKVEIVMPNAKRTYTDYMLLKKIENKWKIISKTAAALPSNDNGKRILFIVSNAEFHGSSSKAAGVSFSEIINAYGTFRKAGYSVDFVSPKGGDVPLIYVKATDPSHRKSLYDADLMYALSHTFSPSGIQAKNYQAVHYVGGSNAMYGVANNKALQRISMSVYEDYNGIVSSVCHGTAGIVNLKTKNGKYLVANKRVSGYPERYESQRAEYFKQFPFHIQKTIEKHHGIFLYSPAGKPHIEVDGRLITGQNHLSSSLVAEAIIQALEK